jgi:hypothetical protein
MATNWGCDARVRAREGIKLRQVLIDAATPGEKILEDMDNTELARKANEVVSTMGAIDTHRIVSARRLSNGGIVFEFTSEEAAKWVNEAQHRIQFTQAIALDARIKTRLYPLVLQFILLHFGPERSNELRAIEGHNKLPCGAIDKARWLKPTHRRSPNQTCGHALFTFTSPETANKVLTDGLIICQKRVYAEKCKKEPIRCLKCHRWNHLSYACPQQHDTCGTCGDRHKTSTCAESGKMRCTSCKTDDHTSWDRACPTFLHKCNELNARMPENQMPYFITEEPWTQVIQPTPTTVLSPAIWTPQERPNSNDWQTATYRKGKYKQTTIPFQHTSQGRPNAVQEGPTHQRQRGSPATSANQVNLGTNTRWGDTDGNIGLPTVGRN